MKFLLILFFTINASFGVVPDTASHAPVFIDTLNINDLSDSVVIQPAVVRDTLVQLHLSSQIADDVNFTINKNEFYRNDYRYTADILRASPFTFIRDLGSGGKPEELNLFGAGNRNISFLNDGLLLNQRINNNFNLTYVNSETIDSIEIISPVRGFLYGTDNNLTAVNVIGKDFLSRTPYSRLKFYEADYGEAMFDGTFNAYVYRNVNLYFNFNNRIYGRRFINDEYSNWNAKVRVKYFVSPFLNLVGTYSMHFSEAQLNGGVDFESIQNTSTQPNTLLYNSNLAPVHQNDRNEKVNLHNFDLALIHKFSDSFYGSLSFYSRYHLYRSANDYTDSIRLNNKEETKTLGLIARQNFNLGSFNFRFEGIVEKIDFFMNPDFYVHSLDFYNEFSFSLNGYKSAVSAISSYSLFDEKIIHSFFYKYSNLIDKNHRNGGGTDLQIKLSEKLKLYIGASVYETWENKLRAVAEGNVQFNNNSFSAGINYFYYTNKNTFSSVGTLPYSHLSFRKQEAFSFPSISFVDLTGVGGNLTLQIWKFSLEARGAYYYDVKAKSTYSRLPSFTANGGIYFKSILFNDNLNLKTGFNFKSGGAQSYYYINQQRWINVPAYFTIDFFAAGEIQESAFIYFVFENLFNRQYFITPFYPIHERGVRFGVAWEFLN